MSFRPLAVWLNAERPQVQKLGAFLGRVYRGAHEEGTPTAIAPELEHTLHHEAAPTRLESQLPL